MNDRAMKYVRQSGQESRIFCRQPFCTRGESRASSLVVSLLVIVVLSTIVVAFMQSMSIERSISRSYLNRERARQAAEAGMQTAIKQIQIAMGTNQGFVTGLTNHAATFGPVTIIGRTNLTNSTQIMPLVSGPINASAAFVTPAWSAQLTTYLAELTGSNTVDINTSKHIIQETADTNAYRAIWFPMTDSNGKTTSRFAYIVQDETARINPALHNGTGSQSNPTNWYSGPADIALTNSSAKILTKNEADQVDGMTNFLWTYETLGQAFAHRSNFVSVKHLLSVNTNPTFDVIPQSLAQGGQPKYNINVAATNAAIYVLGSTNAAETMAGLIQTNLPTFASRDPSLRGNSVHELRYLNRLAANIVDYIDADSAPTYVNGGEPAGKDLHPLVTAIATRYRRTAMDTNSDPVTTTIESQVFVQVWNPYTTTSSLTEARFVMKNQMNLYFGTGIVTPFTDYDQTITTNLTVRPNEFIVMEFSTTNQTWTSPAPATNAPRILGSFSESADGTTWPTFELFIDKYLVDMQRRSPVGPGTATGGLQMFAKTFSTSGNTYACSFIPTRASAPTWRFVGDPRANFLTTYDWTPISSDTSYPSDTRWKGRQMDTSPRYQNHATSWLNRDFTRTNAAMGTAPDSLNTTPADVVSAYNFAVESLNAPAVIRNGPMQSIGELGNVFDPVQAADDLTAPSGGSPSSTFLSGGGRTLRIGQPEFSVSGTNTWNINGRRAMELLDVFTVAETNSTSREFPVTMGQINVNTASKEVLEVVLASIAVTSDSGLGSASLTNLPTISSNIIANRPYGRLSDLNKITTQFAQATNYTPAFGVSIGGGTTNIAAYDRAREECFGKFVQNITIQSRTYRIFVIGEALDTQGKPSSRSIGEFIVYFRSDPAGNFEPVVQFKQFDQ